MMRDLSYKYEVIGSNLSVMIVHEKKYHDYLINLRVMDRWSAWNLTSQRVLFQVLIMKKENQGIYMLFYCVIVMYSYILCVSLFFNYFKYTYALYFI